MKKVGIVFLSLMLFANQAVFGIHPDVKRDLKGSAKGKVGLRLPQFKLKQSPNSEVEVFKRKMEQKRLAEKYSKSLELLGEFVSVKLPNVFSDSLKKRLKFFKKIRKKIKGMEEEEKRFILSLLAEVLIKVQIGNECEIIDILGVGYVGVIDWFNIEGPNGKVPDFIDYSSRRKEYNVYGTKTLKRVLVGFYSKINTAKELLNSDFEKCRLLGKEVLKHSLMAIRMLESKTVKMSVLCRTDFEIIPKNIWDAMIIYLDPIKLDVSRNIYDYNPDVIETLKKSFIEDILQEWTDSTILRRLHDIQEKSFKLEEEYKKVFDEFLFDDFREVLGDFGIELEYYEI